MNHRSVAMRSFAFAMTDHHLKHLGLVGILNSTLGSLLAALGLVRLKLHAIISDHTSLTHGEQNSRVHVVILAISSLLNSPPRPSKTTTMCCRARCCKNTCGDGSSRSSSSDGCQRSHQPCLQKLHRSHPRPRHRRWIPQQHLHGPPMCLASVVLRTRYGGFSPLLPHDVCSGFDNEGNDRANARRRPEFKSDPVVLLVEEDDCAGGGISRRVSGARMGGWEQDSRTAI